MSATKCILMNGSDCIKVRFIAEDKTKEFKKGELLEARIPKSATAGKWYAITNRFGEHYAYPAEWFEIVEELDH